MRLQTGTAKTWWGRRWLEILERSCDGETFRRFKAYARRARVIVLDIQEGVLTAKIKEEAKKPCFTRLRMNPLNEADWAKVTAGMAGQAKFAAKLLAGEMPEGIEEVFSRENLLFFPRSPDDLAPYCSCSDSSALCRHMASIYFLTAGRLDEDPFLIFQFRGRPKDRLLRDLGQKRPAAYEGPISKPAGETASPFLSVQDQPDRFWEPGMPWDVLEAALRIQKENGPVFQKPGDPPAALGGSALASLIAKIYARASQAASETLRS